MTAFSFSSGSAANSVIDLKMAVTIASLSADWSIAFRALVCLPAQSPTLLFDSSKP
jgi:hypothetical protein